ncbi:MAG TPA: 2-dehydropantoate 2-reductase [Opitutus sp.]|nr:2-dehydropantoate 2-reductase [Opitutus sp.]
MKTSSLALIGPGAIGCTLIAHLAATGRFDLTVAARSPLDRIEVETETGVLRCEPRVCTAPTQVLAPVDWVLVATKAYDVAGALPWLERLCGPETRFALLQNGVEHLQRLPERYCRTKLVPVVVDCPAERQAPGRVRQRGPARMIVPDDAAGRAFVELFRETRIQVDTTTDWRTAAWRKLCLNAAGAVSAATLRPSGIVHFPPAADLMRAIVREVVLVGRAEGAQLDDSIVDTVIENTRRAPHDAVNSMHADRAAGRPMEIDARNGVVVRLGRRHGIPTPCNEALTNLLLTLELPEQAQP